MTVQSYGRSADGRTIIVRGQPRKADGTNAGPSRLYTRALDQYEFKELAGTEGVQLFLPPRHDSVLFVAPVSEGSPQLRVSRIPLDGSAPPTGVLDYNTSWSYLDETEDGDLLGVQGNTNLVRIPRGGGAPSAPVKLDAGRPGISQYHLWGMLPGGGGVLTEVVAYDARGWHFGVGVLDPSTGKIKIIEEDGGSPAYSPTGHLLFTRGNTLLATPFDPVRGAPLGPPVAVWSGLSTSFSFLPAYFELASDGGLVYRPGKIGGERLMAFVDASGRLEPWAGEPRGVDTGPEPSPDGRRFACSIVNGRGIDELWVSDLGRPGYQRLGTDPDADCTWGQWSPDGRRIAYNRHGKDARDGVYVQSTDGGAAKRVLAPRSEQERSLPYSWLPDGSALLLAVTTPGSSAIALLTLAGDEADPSRLRILASGTGVLNSPRVSPEGRRLAYESDESGKTQVYVSELHSDRTLGHPVPVRSAEGHDPRWSRDGKWIFLRDERNHVLKAAVGAPPDLVLSAPEDVLDLDKLGVTLWSVLPDGRFFTGLKNEDEGDVTKLNLVLGWTEELKRKMRAAR